MSKHKHDRNPHDKLPYTGEREQSEHEQIQLLAYRYWRQRGSPEGDPETDWQKAEHEFARQREAATRL
jgi:hypothetical protein